jgi:hypothetical protein
MLGGVGGGVDGKPERGSGLCLMVGSMKKLFAFAATAALTTGLVSAQAADIVSNPRGMLSSFDVASIGPILTELEAVWQARTTSDGQTYIAINVGGSLALNIIPTACSANNTQCVGMNIIALFSGGALNHQTVTAFNQNYWFSTAGLTPDNQAAYISRYEISDYGISRGNVATSLVTLVQLAEVFRSELATSRKTVAFEGYAEDLSSRRLNATGLSALAGMHALPSGEKHKAAMEQTSELVRVLLSDRDAPRNKILNVSTE